MEGCFFAKDGERTRASLDQSDTGAPSRAPSQGSRLFLHADADACPDAPSWVRDHEAVNRWLRAIPPADRPDFLRRIAANIECIHTSRSANLEPEDKDAVLSYAILIEYAQHLGLSPSEVCWTFEAGEAEAVDPLLGARVDRMLADADRRRAEPRRCDTDALRPLRSAETEWKTVPGRRAADRREREVPAWEARGTHAFHAADSNRAG